MKRNKRSIWSVGMRAAVLLLSLPPVAGRASETGAVSIHGAYLGTNYAFHQENRGLNDARRNRFDFALNLDFEYRMNEMVNVFAELQGGTDDNAGNVGNLGLVGRGMSNNVEVTDLFAEIDLVEQTGLAITIGSFDTPFGEEVAALSNNAGIQSNAFVQNSLFYAAFGGNMGTLNTLGVMARAGLWGFDLTGAVTNGTDESANNADGNYEFVGAIAASPVRNLRIGGAYMASDDTTSTGNSGFGADFTGWIGEARWDVVPEVGYIKGYYGRMDYGDKNAMTRDGVAVWMAEARCGAGRWWLAGRLSGWRPDDRDGDGTGVSVALPNPGLATTKGGVAVVADQSVDRLQIGGGCQLRENFELRGEWFRDDYRRPSGGRSTDVTGYILALGGTF